MTTLEFALHLAISDAPSHRIGGTVGRNLATPTRGTTDLAVWTLTLDPGAAGLPHSVSAEEVFVLVSGEVTAETEGRTHALRPGDAFVTKPDVDFRLGNTGDTPAVLTVCARPGTTASVNGSVVQPPWAQ
ncbi:cupin domain-containing protein [Phytomonospora sp. NPDC050363]|uniref:cupin domain-containing protein n=1 Tax=Phytomonospora sp. NPDC050363 TaxID=3155642 RepID=UPI0033DC35CB